MERLPDWKNKAHLPGTIKNWVEEDEPAENLNEQRNKRKVWQD